MKPVEEWNDGILEWWNIGKKERWKNGMMEYWNHLNIALGSCGEFHSCYESFKKASQITDEEYDSLDKLHYMVENKLLKLIESLQKKQKDKEWEDNLSDKNYT